MPLQRGEVLGYDFNRMVVDFTMFNQGKTVRCAISTAAMDDLEGKHDVKADQRVDPDLLISDGCDWRGVIAKLFAKSMRPVIIGKPLLVVGRPRARGAMNRLRFAAHLFELSQINAVVGDSNDKETPNGHVCREAAIEPLNPAAWRAS
jgi:Protein of unknown function (DUF1488)